MLRWLLWRIAKVLLLLLAGLYLVWGGSLFLLKRIDPWTTGVQAERRIGALWSRASYTKRYEFVPLEQISPHLQHAVIAAEDGRFFEHHGIDWREVENVVEESAEAGHVTRGASTITQQLIKNLFFSTRRSTVRKLFEYTLAPMAEMILGKQRILELYLNVIEWGPGVYGAEAAAEFHYKTSAGKIDREQAARLAACLPAPLRRRPEQMHRYAVAIQTRMRQAGW